MPSLDAKLCRMLGVGKRDSPYSRSSSALNAMGVLTPNLTTDGVNEYAFNEAMRLEDYDKLPKLLQDFIRRCALSVKLAYELYPDPPGYRESDPERQVEITDAVIARMEELGEMPSDEEVEAGFDAEDDRG